MAVRIATVVGRCVGITLGIALVGACVFLPLRVAVFWWQHPALTAMQVVQQRFWECLLPLALVGLIILLGHLDPEGS